MVSMGAWMWIGEHEQVNKTESFLEYFVNIEGISKEYSLTWHIIYHDIEEYFATCTWMKKINWVKREMDEKLKWVNTICSQPKVMCECKIYLLQLKGLCQ
jgi:hypothetical protein